LFSGEVSEVESERRVTVRATTDPHQERRRDEKEDGRKKD
jgi:hypothetical protein